MPVKVHLLNDFQYFAHFGNMNEKINFKTVENLFNLKVRPPLIIHCSVIINLVSKER